MNAKPLLVLSVIANISLLSAVGYLVKNPTTREAAPAEDSKPPVTNSSATISSLPGKRVITVTNNLEKTFDWRAVESADYKEYIANLRSVGCPEETIRDIIVADVNKMFESRKKELTSSKKFEFWKTGNMFAAMVDEETLKKKQALAQEKKALIRELLGIEIDEPTDLAAVANPLTSMLDFLPEDKQSKISEMMQSYQAKAMKSFSGGSPDAEDMKAMQKVQKEFEAELAKVLSPQEYEDYQLRLSQTSMMMRMQLGSFDPNEQEFRDIFKLRKGFDDEFGLYGSGASTKEERDRKEVAEKKMKEDIKSLLGDDRYAEYTRAQDRKYQGIVKIADRNGIPRETANQVYEMDKISRDEISKVRGDTSLDKARRDELIKAIQDETQTSIRGALGDKAYESYTNNPSIRY